MSSDESKRLQEQYGISEANADFVIGSLQKWKESGISQQTPDQYLAGVQEAIKDKGMSLEQALTAFRETSERNPALGGQHDSGVPPKACPAKQLEGLAI